MSKKKDATKKIDDVSILDVPDFEILSAKLKDGLCNYSVENMKEPTKGFILDTKGVNVVHEDLTESFKALVIHLAIVDGVFALTGKDFDYTHEVEKDELATSYSVSGFKLGGSEDNRSVILHGSKWVPGGVISLDTFKLTKAYKHYDTLMDEIKVCQEEVLAYKNGKCDEEMFSQTAIDFPEELSFEEAAV